jgi:hypothetical protein
MYGPPGTGKTLLARACAAQTDATFLKLAGPQLVQMFIGDGAKLVRDCFALAKEKAPSIIFIDELDAIGTKRFDSDKSGDREVQRTMLELLNQLDGFASDDRIKVLAATNRVDVLDPALLRSGRLDRKIEFPLPNEEARAQILRIHSRKMTVDDAVNWPELARSTDEFGGAQLKAVCVEAGMIALRKGQNKIGHEHYVDAISEVQAKKKVGQFDKNGQSPLNVVLTASPRTLSTSTLKQHATMAAQAVGWCVCKTNGIESTSNQTVHVPTNLRLPLSLSEWPSASTSSRHDFGAGLLVIFLNHGTAFRYTFFCLTQRDLHLTHRADSARIHGDSKSYTFNVPSWVNQAAESHVCCPVTAHGINSHFKDTIVQLLSRGIERAHQPVSK